MSPLWPSYGAKKTKLPHSNDVGNKHLSNLNDWLENMHTMQTAWTFWLICTFSYILSTFKRWRDIGAARAHALRNKNSWLGRASEGWAEGGTMDSSRAKNVLWCTVCCRWVGHQWKPKWLPTSKRRAKISVCSSAKDLKTEMLASTIWLCCSINN